MGRKRIDDAEKKATLTINLQQKIIDNIKLANNDKKPKHVIEELVKEKYTD